MRIARVYDEHRDAETRVLVDRLWPRGLSRERAAIDVWLKEIAPSTELRKWYAHDPARFDDFVQRYRLELDDPTHAQAVERLHDLAGEGEVVLLTSTTDLALSHLATLASIVDGS